MNPFDEILNQIGAKPKPKAKPTAPTKKAAKPSKPLIDLLGKNEQARKKGEATLPKKDTRSKVQQTIAKTVGFTPQAGWTLNRQEAGVGSSLESEMHSWDIQNFGVATFGYANNVPKDKRALWQARQQHRARLEAKSGGMMQNRAAGIDQMNRVNTPLVADNNDPVSRALGMGAIGAVSPLTMLTTSFQNAGDVLAGREPRGTTDIATFLGKTTPNMAGMSDQELYARAAVSPITRFLQEPASFARAGTGDTRTVGELPGVAAGAETVANIIPQLLAGIATGGTTTAGKAAAFLGMDAPQYGQMAADAGGLQNIPGALASQFTTPFDPNASEGDRVSSAINALALTLGAGVGATSAVKGLRGGNKAPATLPEIINQRKPVTEPKIVDENLPVPTFRTPKAKVEPEVKPRPAFADIEVTQAKPRAKKSDQKVIAPKVAKPAFADIPTTAPKVRGKKVVDPVVKENLTTEVASKPKPMAVKDPKWAKQGAPAPTVAEISAPKPKEATVAPAKMTDDELVSALKLVAPNERPKSPLWAEYEQRRNLIRSKQVAKLAEEDASKQAEIHSSYQGFTDNMTAPNAKRAKDALDRNVLVNKRPITRKTLVESKIAEGDSITIAPDGKRRLSSPKGSFVEESQISKTAMDYAEYLIQRKQATLKPTRAKFTPEEAKGYDGGEAPNLVGMAKGKAPDVAVEPVLPKPEPTPLTANLPNVKFPVSARAKARGMNATVVYPPKVGGKFSEPEISSIKAWAKDNGYMITSATPTKIDVIGDIGDGRKVAAMVAEAKAPTKAQESNAQKVAEYESRQKERAKEYEDAVSTDAGKWVEDNFDSDFANPANKAALIKFLNGETQKFEGLASSKWAKSVTRLNAVVDGRVDFEKLKSEYLKSRTEPTPSKPDAKVEPSGAKDDSITVYRYATRMRPPSPGAVPRDGLIGTAKGGKWGVAEYSRELTAKEIKDYELDTLPARIEPKSAMPGSFTPEDRQGVTLSGSKPNRRDPSTYPADKKFFFDPSSQYVFDAELVRQSKLAEVGLPSGAIELVTPQRYVEKYGYGNLADQAYAIDLNKGLAEPVYQNPQANKVLAKSIKEGIVRKASLAERAKAEEQSRQKERFDAAKIVLEKIQRNQISAEEWDVSYKNSWGLPSEFMATAKSLGLENPSLTRKQAAQAKFSESGAKGEVKEPWQMTVEELRGKYKDYISDGIGYGDKYNRSIDDSFGATAQAIQKGNPEAAEIFGMQLKLRAKEITFDEYQDWDKFRKEAQVVKDAEATREMEKTIYSKAFADTPEGRIKKSELKKPIFAELAKSDEVKALLKRIDDASKVVNDAKSARNNTKPRSKAREAAEATLKDALDKYEALLNERDAFKAKLSDQAEQIMREKAGMVEPNPTRKQAAAANFKESGDKLKSLDVIKGVKQGKNRAAVAKINPEWVAAVRDHAKNAIELGSATLDEFVQEVMAYVPQKGPKTRAAIEKAVRDAYESQSPKPVKQTKRTDVFDDGSEGTPTGLARRFEDAERQATGKAPTAPQGTTPEALKAWGDREYQRDPVAVANIVQQAFKDQSGLNDIDAAKVYAYKEVIRTKLTKAVKDGEEGTAQILEQELNKISEVAQNTRGLWHRIGQALQINSDVTSDMSVGGLIERGTLSSGGVLDANIKKQLTEIAEKYETAVADLEAYKAKAQAELNALKDKMGASVTERRVARQRTDAIKILTSKGFKYVGEPIPSASGLKSKKSGAMLRPEFLDRDEASAIRQLVNYHIKDSDTTSLTEIVGKIQNDFPDITDRHIYAALSNDYRKAWTEATVAQSRARQVMNSIKRDAEYRKMKPLGRAARITGEILNATQRGLQASFDISAPFIQGLPTAMVSPTTWAKSWGPMLRSLWKGPDGAERVMAQIRNHPSFPEAMQAGLDLSDVNGSFMAQEEIFAGSLIPKIAEMKLTLKNAPMAPLKLAAKGVEHSDAAFTTYMNTTRWSLYQNLMKNAPKGDRERLAFAKDVASIVNVLSGKGTGKPAKMLKSAGEVPGLLLYAPRFYVSLFQNAVLPVGSYQTGKGRAMATRVYAQQAAAILTILGASKMMGAEVDEDPRSTRFGRIQMPNGVEINLFGRVLEPVRTISQMMYGKISAKGTYVAPGKYNDYDIYDWLASKASPILRLADSARTGMRYDDNAGKRVEASFSDMAIANFTPISLRSIIGKAVDEKTPLTLKQLSALEILGINVGKNREGKIDAPKFNPIPVGLQRSKDRQEGKLKSEPGKSSASTPSKPLSEMTNEELQRVISGGG